LYIINLPAEVTLANGKVSHIEYMVAKENLFFYRDLLAFLGFEEFMADETMVGMGGSNGASLWFAPEKFAQNSDYDATGHNHLGIAVDSVEDVDRAITFLDERGISGLFDTPRHRPEFAEAGNTYYQIMFESPDRILIEIVYTGPYTPA